ncbi:MAG: hypothetical protein P4L76_17260 [Beijerinckiaceae bacterium]|nr:hypothetical protein [Beijerinckiaceae bacterium]
MDTVETNAVEDALDAKSTGTPVAVSIAAGAAEPPVDETVKAETATGGGGNSGGGSDAAVNLTIGAVDPNGAVVRCIYAKTDRYVIYLADDRVHFFFPGTYEDAKALRKRIVGLGGLRASIEDLRAEPSLRKLDRARSARELAWALDEAFEDDSQPPSDQPQQTLTRVDDRLRSLVKSYYRKSYVFANLGAFALIEGLLGACDWFPPRFIPDWLPALVAPLPLYAHFGMLGALGAFLSVIAGIRSIEFDVDLERWEHFFAGATRILIGVIGAWVVGLALDSALIDPTFGHHADAAGQAGAAQSQAGAVFGFAARDAMYFILTFIGGFSETLVPNLLRRGEDAAGGGAKSDISPDAPIVKT